MKLLTKEEEAAHYRSVVQGGTVGTAIGLVGGLAGVMAASRRFHTIRNLTLPMKAFLVTSSGTFVGIIAADHASRQYEAERNVNMRYLENREERLRREELAQMSFSNRLTAWAREEKYKIIGVTWIASIIGSFVLVGRNPYLTGQQKIVQARVYAQGLTLAVMCASAAFEIHDQRKGQGLLDTAKKGREAAKESSMPEHQRRDENADLWRDMVAAEEAKLRQRHKPLFEHELKEQQEALENKKEEQSEEKEETVDDNEDKNKETEKGESE
ncbi:mitochondrial hypoxia responsive domain protein [Talaromyces proteolyticus]|uniref:Mitochondrial hypoxia responsive domain protein n=1 Tax=Talaromyces proteolyticus TaxID=1131652 RepID=A0AAD4L4G2_9EURO|nr:mitochondrial hypoxia responsive domain protein [Talaromyces proteolyticus]KAH8704038.1 mitochondrial hypoxia responsive domain protein [Talaromyces proteolyticus]